MLNKIILTENISDELREFSNLSFYGEMLHQKAVKMEEDILIHALHDYLDRKPNIADYMQCSIMYIQGCPNVYTLNYKGFPVGKIERLLEMLSYKFVFTPFVPV